MSEVVASNLKQLMEDAGIGTFVPLAKAVGVAPQQLYSRKDKDGNYKYDSIEKYLLKNSPEGTTIESIVEKAKAGVAEKVAKKAENKTKKENIKKAKEQEKQEKLAVFTEGSIVSYDTYRVRDGVREDYSVTARVKSVGEDQIILVRIEDGKDGSESTMAKATATKKLKVISVAAPAEATDRGGT